MHCAWLQSWHEGRLLQQAKSRPGATHTRPFLAERCGSSCSPWWYSTSNSGDWLLLILFWPDIIWLPTFHCRQVPEWLKLWGDKWNVSSLKILCDRYIKIIFITLWKCSFQLQGGSSVWGSYEPDSSWTIWTGKARTASLFSDLAHHGEEPLQVWKICIITRIHAPVCLGELDTLIKVFPMLGGEEVSCQQHQGLRRRLILI